MVHQIVKERSAKDLPTTYKEVAPLLEDIKDPERQARKTLEQLLKLNLNSDAFAYIWPRGSKII